ncbi:MAG: sugar transferase [Planctomycetaceae bacterium]|nr:sugar transferase [Planctomycetaceae bacterium]
MYTRFFKRAADLGIAGFLLVLLSPVMLITALLIRWKLGSPVIFSQVRAGRNGHAFTILKFRTMLNAENASGEMLPDDQRLTKFGRFLRASSLDELPQLFNIVRGDMSMVGPRPLLTHYLPRYTTEQARRHEVRPGVTGWAQVNGRNALNWEQKFQLDVWYVDHCSPWLDLSILLKTIYCVLRRQGISSTGHATMPEFMGTDATRDAAGAS